MCDPGWIGIANQSPEGGWWWLLLRSQVSQGGTYSLVSFSREGHQKVRLSNEMVQLTTGWQAKREAWVYCRTWEQTDEGTNSGLGSPIQGWLGREILQTINGCSASSSQCWCSSKAEASTYTTSGWTTTGAELNLVLSSLKAWTASMDHKNSLEGEV